MQEFLLVNWLPNANFGPLATGQSILPDVYLSHAARSFVLKDSHIMWEVENKTMKGDKLFGVNSITCVLSNSNPLLNYPVVIPMILIYMMVSIYTQFCAILSRYGNLLHF